MRVFNKLLLVVFIIYGNVYSKNIYTGTTYEIIENDAEVELLNRVQGVNWDSRIKEKNDSDKWNAINTEYLPLAQESIIRTYVPFYKSDFEIKTPKGKVIYPKGYSFNPLRFMKLPNKIYIITPSTAKYFAGKISNSDQIILANGNPLDQRDLMKAPVFSLDSKTKERLGINKAPSIIWQEGAMLKIQEISIKDLTNETID